MLSEWGGSEGEVSFGKDDGEDFNQVEVALIPIVKDYVPDELGIGGHVVVSDHAVVPPTTELHADVAPDEGMSGERGGVTVDPSRPMGQRGVRWWGRGERLHSLSPCRQQRGESLMSPHVEWGWVSGWARR